MNKVEMITASAVKALTDARNTAILNMLIEVERISNATVRSTDYEVGNYYTTLRISAEGLSDTVIANIEQYFMNLGYSVAIEEIILNGTDLLEIRLSWVE